MLTISINAVFNFQCSNKLQTSIYGNLEVISTTEPRINSQEFGKWVKYQRIQFDFLQWSKFSRLNPEIALHPLASVFNARFHRLFLASCCCFPFFKFVHAQQINELLDYIQKLPIFFKNCGLNDCFSQFFAHLRKYWSLFCTKDRAVYKRVILDSRTCRECP